MSETNNEQTNEAANEETAAPAVAETQAPADSSEMQKLVEQRVQEELKSIKSKLDAAYSARDEAVKLKVALEEEKRTQAIKQMEEEGRHKEVGELRMAEMQAKLESLTKENTQLSRDHAVTEALRGIEFRSDIAGEMARDRILAQLVQDDNGAWKHKSGATIKEYAKLFASDEDNSFLFKAKTNSGTGGTAQGVGSPDSNEKLTPREQLEALAKSFGQSGALQGF